MGFEVYASTLTGGDYFALFSFMRSTATKPPTRGTSPIFGRLSQIHVTDLGRCFYKDSAVLGAGEGT